MLQLLRDWASAKGAELKSRATEARLQEQAWADYSRLSQAYFDMERYGVPGLTGATDPLRMATQDFARAEARLLARNNAFARNIVNQIVNFTVGPGFAIRFDDPAMAEEWERDEVAMRWARRRREIVRRIARDGECFLRAFGDELRFVEPETIATPTHLTSAKNVIDGVEFDPEDAETILGYWISGEFVEAKFVYQFKDPFCEMNRMRGWPMLYDAKAIIERYESWLNIRAVLNQMRASIVLFRKHKGATPTQLSSYIGKVKGGSMSRADGSDQPYQMRPLPGTIIDHLENVEYEFKSPNIGASDVAEDGRSMRLLICAFFSFPEYLVTGDASNANFASTAIAENPGVKTFQSWQEYFGADLIDFFRWWYEDSALKIKLTWPAVIVRDKLNIDQAYAIENEHGVLSVETWMELVGLDPKVELPRVLAMEANRPEPPPPEPPEPGDDQTPPDDGTGDVAGEQSGDGPPAPALPSGDGPEGRTGG